MKTILISILFSIAGYSFAQQPSKVDAEQNFCNVIKDLIIEQDVKTIYSFLSNDLKNDSLVIAKSCKKYGLYIDSHLLEFNDYWGYKDTVDNAIHYGYRWSTSQNSTKCLIEMVVSPIENGYEITQLIFGSKVGSLSTVTFPQEAVCTYPIELTLKSEKP
ncbi:MAG: hypothetical protein H6598_03235 [Flavobacteriales bacterium]|nr:hypothetical protein [Flavobacteriales bacterium]